LAQLCFTHKSLLHQPYIWKTPPLINYEQDFAARFPQLCTALNSLPADLSPTELVEFRSEVEKDGMYAAAVALLDRRRNEIQHELSLSENRLRTFTGPRALRLSA
jgi:hypothetical protein